MFLLRLKDSKMVLARRRTENAAREAMKRRQRSCPAEMEIVDEPKNR